MIQFYSNNTINLHHLTTHSRRSWPTKWRSYCDHRYATSFHPIYMSICERIFDQVFHLVLPLVGWHQYWQEEYQSC